MFYHGSLKDYLLKVLNRLQQLIIVLLQALNYYDDFEVRVKFTGSCLKQPKILYTHKKVVNIYIVHELGASTSNNSDTTLKNCLFGAVTLTKHSDIDKYGYSGYGIGFDRTSSFSFPAGGFGWNVLNFGVYTSSSAHIDNKKKEILVLGKGPTQGLEHTCSNKKEILFVFALQWDKQLFVNGIEIIKFKVKDSEIVPTPLCLGNISKDWSTDNMKRTGLTGYVYDFRAGYDPIAVNDIIDIHKYLMKKNNIV